MGASEEIAVRCTNLDAPPAGSHLVFAERTERTFGRGPAGTKDGEDLVACNERLLNNAHGRHFITDTRL
jgi:hypothetical protein